MLACSVFLWLKSIADIVQLLPVLGRAAMSLCSDATNNLLYHVGKGAWKQVRAKPTEECDHYLFLYAAASDCASCCKFWLANGASISRGTTHHPEWNALAFAEHAGAQRWRGISCFIF